MKSIKEKQLLVKWSKAMNEAIDPALVEEVERYEQLQKDIIESVRSNSIKDLQEASVVAEQFVEKINIEYPKPPTLNEVLEVLKEEQNELVQAQTTQEPTAPAKPTTLADRAADHISREVRLEEKSDSFQQPDPTLVEKNLNAIQKKLKFLEQAISKITAHGPGSGEVRFLKLDDINYQSWQDRDRHKILKYEPNVNPAYDGVTFGFLTGDQGPIYSLKYDVAGYTGNANVAAGLTAWNPNKDCLDIHQADGSICQVGLENYIRVANETGNTLNNGDFVIFSGINGTLENPVPKVDKFLADANSVPLYAVGVLTNDIQTGSDGRATVLGEVRGINTTGNVVGETWYAGNLLWAHPALPGKLTVTKPTAPNVAVSVAAVLKADADEGILLVRPTLAPRLYYGSFISTLPATAPNTTSGHAITLNRTEFTSGFYIQDSTKITAKNSGLYNFQFSIQFTSTNSSAKQIYIWPRKNGVNIEDSSTVYTITGNGVNIVPYLNYVISLLPDEYVEIYWAVSDTAAEIASPAVPAYSPNIPPVILTVTEVAL